MQMSYLEQEPTGNIGIWNMRPPLVPSPELPSLQFSWASLVHAGGNHVTGSAGLDLNRKFVITLCIPAEQTSPSVNIQMSLCFISDSSELN